MSKGNMQSVIDNTETAQQRRKNLLARYPDVSETGDGNEYHARSAAKDAHDVFVEGDILIAYARLTMDGTSLAGPCELPVHVRCGGMPIVAALQMLREKHPDAWATLLAVVKEGHLYSGKDDIPW